MPELVTLPQAKAHLNITSDAQNDDIYLKLQAAQSIVVSHLTQRDAGEFAAIVAAWTALTVPDAVKIAILIQTGELFRVRGDDQVTDTRANHGQLSPVVESVLMAWKDPGIA